VQSKLKIKKNQKKCVKRYIRKKAFKNINAHELKSVLYKKVATNQKNQKLKKYFK